MPQRAGESPAIQPTRGPSIAKWPSAARDLVAHLGGYGRPSVTSMLWTILRIPQAHTRDVEDLRRKVTGDPTCGYSMDTLHLDILDVPDFAATYCSKLPRLTNIRSETKLALSTFQSITRLVLSGFWFSRALDLTRVLASFPKINEFDPENGDLFPLRVLLSVPHLFEHLTSIKFDLRARVTGIQITFACFPDSAGPYLDAWLAVCHMLQTAILSADIFPLQITSIRFTGLHEADVAHIRAQQFGLFSSAPKLRDILALSVSPWGSGHHTTLISPNYRESPEFQSSSNYQWNYRSTAEQVQTYLEITVKLSLYLCNTESLLFILVLCTYCGIVRVVQIYQLVSLIKVLMSPPEFDIPTTSLNALDLDPFMFTSPETYSTATGSSLVRSEVMDSSGVNIDDCVQTRFPSPVGGLPLELWWNIFEIVNDPRTLLNCGCACKTFCDVVQEIISGRSEHYEHGSAKTVCLGIVGQELGTRLPLRFQMRFALSRLKTVTTLKLWDILFSSFSDFARTICALPNLSTLDLYSVTLNDNGSYSLNDLYFAGALSLKMLKIGDCGFGEVDPIWNVLTAPLLSDSLERIKVLCGGDNLEHALGELSIPPGLLLSECLEQLKQVRFDLWKLSCTGSRDVATSTLLFRSPASRITAIEIGFWCQHTSPHLIEWKLLFSILDDAVAASDFGSLKTITVFLATKHAFDVDYVRAATASQSYSPKWMDMFNMCSISFSHADFNETHSSGAQISKKTDAAAEAVTEEITLSIELGPRVMSKYRATVMYARCPYP
ncbi:hypothetical protein CERSUDRAFT_69823 [Gelatoporia subvermispora B]|uniref:F-box domain-containing protein n=1 Tax=Ceriporiopsis subvermispora (strain B) TaxID=914234 RepID=M2RQP6_CERS8|nr:hypothetical protein CERSUDRAFT_69823 [Gelatoporia subvermispora B]